MTLPDPYHARRRRKVRLITGVGFFLLALFGTLIGIGSISTLTTPITVGPPGHQYLASLPYPDPHPDQAALLIFTPSGRRTAISTHWLRLTPSPDAPRPPDAVYFRFETVIDGPARAFPVDHALLHLAATGDARLPIAFDIEAPLFFDAGRRITLTTSPKLLADARNLHAPPPPLHDPMLYMIHPDAILDLLAHPSPTMTIGRHTAQLTEAHLTPLRALAATLKPGYTPPATTP
jgi:hypothetical protein